MDIGCEDGFTVWSRLNMYISKDATFVSHKRFNPITGLQCVKILIDNNLVNDVTFVIYLFLISF